MLIKENTKKKVCDMGTCRNIAEFCVYYRNTALSTDICKGCLIKLYKGIKKVLYEKEREKKD